MRTRRILTVFALVLTAGFRGVVACSSDDPTTTANAADAGGSAGARLPTPEEIVGALAYGQTSAPVAYRSPPSFRAFTFVGAAGDDVVATVTASSGATLAWILDASGRVLAQDLTAGAQARLAATLSAPGAYSLLFREATEQPTTFTVALSGGPSKGGGPDASSVPDGGAIGDASAGITCVYEIRHNTAAFCAQCVLPGETREVNADVPVKVDDAGPGYHDPTLDGGKGNGRFVHFTAPVMDTFGCPNLKSVALDGVPPDESFTALQSSNPCGMLRYNLDASVRVQDSVDVTAEIHVAHSLPSTDCPGTYGCSYSYLDCTGTATAK